MPETRPEIDVLLVEDAPDVQRIMVQVLLKAGYTVHAVTDGTGAMKQLGDFQYRAIVSDLAMPVMGGIQLFRELQTHDPAQADKIIFVTGSSDSPEAAAFFETVQRPVLYKPYPVKELVRLVAKLVDRRPQILP